MLMILIHNDGTGTNESANYTYEVRVNDSVVEKGNIKGHNRKDGWKVLVGELAKERDVSELHD